MSSPNVSSAPQPGDGIILRGAIQMETALLALRASGRNPMVQGYLGVSLEDTKLRAKTAEENGLAYNETWFILDSEEARLAKQDILDSLEEAETNEDQQLAFAAESLRSLLTAK